MMIGHVCLANARTARASAGRASLNFYTFTRPFQIGKAGQLQSIRPLMNLLDLVVGKPISTSDERAEEIGPAKGIPIFGLDALSSAAYGPEAALSLLIPLGLVGVQYIVPISAAIITLLVIVYFLVSSNHRGVSRTAAARTRWRDSTWAPERACLPRPRCLPTIFLPPLSAFPLESAH